MALLMEWSPPSLVPQWDDKSSLIERSAAIMNVKTIGIDLAKTFSRSMGLTSTENGCSTNNSDGHKWPPFCQHPPCLIGMEACASAHFWANKLISMGHNVKLMALSSSNPMLKPISMMLQTLKLFVKPSLDLTCGSCRSKPLSSKPYWHFTGVVRASSNSEPHKPIKSGVIGRIWHCRPRGIQQLQRRLPELVEDADNPLPVLFRTQLSLLQHHMAYLFDVIATLDKQIEQCYRQNALCQRIGKIRYWPCYRQRADCDHW